VESGSASWQPRSFYEDPRRMAGTELDLGATDAIYTVGKTLFDMAKSGDCPIQPPSPLASY